jgi:hypothetical protein
MPGPLKAVIVGKWSVGSADSGKVVILNCEFSEREPITLALPLNEAGPIAEAIQAVMKSLTKPPQTN